jgi:hypothetical protein
MLMSCTASTCTSSMHMHGGYDSQVRQDVYAIIFRECEVKRRPFAILDNVCACMAVELFSGEVRHTMTRVACQ